MSSKFVHSVVAVVILVGFVQPASADQDALQKVKALYAAAAYEDALAVMAAVPEGTRLAELDQYQAFCLIALGNEEQAQNVIERLLTDNPLYEPDGSETSPRVIDAFREMKTRVMPSVTKSLYLEAKAALERKERKEAIAGFEMLLRVMGPGPAGDSTLDDMRVLAEGFLDLSRALPEAAPATPAPGEAGKTAAANANAPGVSPLASAALRTRPVMIRQDMPPWNAPDSISRRTEFRGVVRVMVGIDGKVQSSEIVRSIHPLYDRLLLAASQEWLYEPAKEDGKPVVAEVLVAVHLRPEN